MFSMTYNKIPVKVQSETWEKIRGFQCEGKARITQGQMT